MRQSEVLFAPSWGDVPCPLPLLGRGVTQAAADLAMTLLSGIGVCSGEQWLARRCAGAKRASAGEKQNPRRGSPKLETRWGTGALPDPPALDAPGAEQEIRADPEYPGGPLRVPRTGPAPGLPGTRGTSCGTSAEPSREVCPARKPGDSHTNLRSPC